MRNLRSHPTQRRDHYQELTDRIIVALEAGVAPWRSGGRRSEPSADLAANRFAVVSPSDLGSKAFHFRLAFQQLRH